MSCESWDTDKTLKFIAEFEKRPVLWKKADQGCHNGASKQAAWKEMSEIFEESVSVLKKKMDSLRGSRRREKSRIQRSMKTGQKNIYVTKWFAWDAFMFLDDPEDIRNAMSEEETSEEPKETAVKRKYRPEKKTIYKKKATKQETPSVENPSVNEQINLPQSTVQTDSKKRDTCDIFGEYIAEELRKHDDRTRMILQHEIHNLFFQAVVNPHQFLSQWPSQSQYEMNIQ